MARRRKTVTVLPDARSMRKGAVSDVTACAAIARHTLGTSAMVRPRDDYVSRDMLTYTVRMRNRVTGARGETLTVRARSTRHAVSLIESSLRRQSAATLGEWRVDTVRRVA